MIQDSCISIDFITTAMAVKLGTKTDMSEIYRMLLQQAMKAKLSILNMMHHFKKCSYRQQPTTSSDSQFSPTFTDYFISFLLNGNVNVIFSFISTVFIVNSRNECDIMANDCDFNCFVSFQLMFCSNYIIANFTCTLKRYRKESSTY